MHPVICTVGPFTIYAYGLMLAIACIVGTLLAQVQAKKEHIAAEIVFNFTFLSVLSGIIGARIFYVVESIYICIGITP